MDEKEKIGDNQSKKSWLEVRRKVLDNVLDSLSVYHVKPIDAIALLSGLIEILASSLNLEFSYFDKREDE